MFHTIVTSIGFSTVAVFVSLGLLHMYWAQRYCGGSHSHARGKAIVYRCLPLGAKAQSVYGA